MDRETMLEVLEERRTRAERNRENFDSDEWQWEFWHGKYNEATIIRNRLLERWEEE